MDSWYDWYLYAVDFLLLPQGCLDLIVSLYDK